MITLNIEPRGAVKADALRKKGKLPAVFYGPKEQTTSIAVSAIEFGKVWKKAGESSVIILNDGTNEHEALIHEIDVHPVTGVPRHADFYVIEKGKKVKVKVQLEFVGVSPAVKDLGGILVKVLREIEVEAAAKDLPHDLKVDISHLKELTSVIHVSDLKIPTGVTIVGTTDEVVASISEAKEEVEEVAAPIDMSAIEVEKKGKEEKEGEEGAAAGAGDAKKDAGKEGKKEEKKG